MKIFEAGIIGNGMELVKVVTEDLDDEYDSSNSEHKSAILHSILVYHRTLTNSEINSFSMKNLQIFLNSFSVSGGDIVFYVIIKKVKFFKPHHVLFDLKPRFSNLKNKYLQIIGEEIPSELSRYKPLEHVIGNMFKLRKKSFF